MPDVAMSLLYVDDEEHNLSVFRAAFRHPACAYNQALRTPPGGSHLTMPSRLEGR